MGGNFGELINSLFKFCLFSLFVLLPLALWKLVEIIIWVSKHIHWG